MYQNQTIAIVVPCYNEALQITKVLAQMPDFVDTVYVIDDQSTDNTYQVASDYIQVDARVKVIQQPANAGVGSAIARGYREALGDGQDVTVVMAGDGQMDPEDLEDVIFPVVQDLADYCKGNRFFYLDGAGVKKIPPIRFVGNFVLSVLTKIVSGYWHVSDTQCGYTAINRRALAGIDLESIYPSYGCPNDILTKLNIADMRVVEVPVNPLYGVGEISKMKIPKVIIPILRLLGKLFVERLVYKYALRAGHPLILVYLLSLILFGFSCIDLAYIFTIFGLYGYIPKVALIVFGMMMIMALQTLLSAFEMDFSYNQSLSIHLNHRQSLDDKRSL